MMTLIKEVFGLLASKGVYRKVQHLFLDVLKDDYWGKLSSDYFGMNGKVLDQEMFFFLRSDSLRKAFQKIKSVSL